MGSKTVPVNPSGLHTLPVVKRPRQTGFASTLRGLVTLFVFLLGVVCVNGTQFCLLPLRILPPTRSLYHDGIRYTKAAFGLLTILMCQLFAPTSIRLTYDPSNGPSQNIEDWVERDPKTGRVLSLNWPKKLVIMANHQVYADWWYIWCLTYFAKMHAYILIILKQSLKWVPVVGWGMQFFDFIFLARSWASDRINLTSTLSTLAAHHTTTTTERPEEDEPLALIIFPEGTVISELTLPVSKKYAEKMGIHHPTNLLLPRSTGLHTTLLALSQLPSLYLMDITVGYPGVPRGGNGQLYYTLRSIFVHGIPPPEIHYHVRFYNVQRDIPLRASSSFGPSVEHDPSLTLAQHHAISKAIASDPSLVEPSAEDKQVFDEWLRARWMEKEEMMDRWQADGQKKMSSGSPEEQEVVMPLELRTLGEAFDAFCWFAPVFAIGWAWKIGLFERIFALIRN